MELIKLPIRLYFENDQPDANTTSDFTNLSYTDSYKKYEDQFDSYKRNVALQRDSLQAIKSIEELDLFFEVEVKKGKEDLERFTNQVWMELQKGNKVQLMVQGFASPLANTDYNVHLTKRRIQSLKNYFLQIQQGKFGSYLLGDLPQLEFNEVPMGELKANKETSDDFYDQKNSVYSKAASQERRIEIIELRSIPSTFVVDLTEIDYPLNLLPEKTTVSIQNTTDKMIELKLSCRTKNNIKVPSYLQIPANQVVNVPIDIIQKEVPFSELIRIENIATKDSKSIRLNVKK